MLPPNGRRTMIMDGAALRGRSKEGPFGRIAVLRAARMWLASPTTSVAQTGPKAVAFPDAQKVTHAHPSDVSSGLGSYWDGIHN